MLCCLTLIAELLILHGLAVITLPAALAISRAALPFPVLASLSCPLGRCTLAEAVLQ